MRGGDVAALVAALVLAGVSAAQASSNEPHEFIGWCVRSMKTRIGICRSG